MRYNSVMHVLTDRIMRLGPAALLAGAGGATLVNVLADINQNVKDREIRDKEGTPKDVITVKLPQDRLDSAAKTAAAASVEALEEAEVRYMAEPDFPAYKAAAGGFMDLFRGWVPPDPKKWPSHPLASNISNTAAVVIPAALAYKAVDGMFKNREKAELDAAQERAKEEYASLLLREIEDGRGESKTAAYGPLDALVDIAVDELDARSPRQSPEDHDGKTASWKHFIDSITGVPVSLAILAGLASHRYRLGKERELDAYYDRQTPKIQGPTRIRLVTEPSVRPDDVMPSSSEPTSSQEEESETRKSAWVGPTMVATKLVEMSGARAEALKAMKEHDEEQAREEAKEREDLRKTTPYEIKDHNTMVVNRADGPVRIDASDPAATEVLEKYRDLLVRTLS